MEIMIQIMIIKRQMIKTDNKSGKCKFENCNRIAKYRKLKVGNCHLKDPKYEYCQYHRPENSVNKNCPYKSIFD